MTHAEDEDGGPGEHGAPYEADDEAERQHHGGVQVGPPARAARDRAVRYQT